MLEIIRQMAEELKPGILSQIKQSIQNLLNNMNGVSAMRPKMQNLFDACEKKKKK